MGMYDYLRCEMPLPDPEVQGEMFQTKDTPAQFLDTYVIRADGRLVNEYPNLEELPGEDPPFWKRTGPPKEVDWTGTMFFYTLDDDGRWYEYRALVWKGVVKELERAADHWKCEDTGGVTTRPE